LGKVGQLGAFGWRLFEYDTFDRTDDDQVAEHRHQRVGADEHQGPFERTGGADDVADDNRRGNRRQVTEGVEQTTTEPGDLFRRG